MHRIAPLLAALVVSLTAGSALADDLLVLTPKEFEPALVAWTKHRKTAGVEVLVRQPGENPGDMVRAVAKERKAAPRWVLLLGDVEQVPCAHVPVVAIAKWEKEKQIATDLPYADLDDDGLPDVAVGRLPAKTVEQAKAMLERVVAYETSTDHGTWARKLHLFGGVGGFGAQQDFALEQLTRTVLTRSVPNSAEVTFSYAKETSPYCPPPAAFARTFRDKVNEGSLVVAYVGHGSRDHLDRVNASDGRHPIFEAAHVEQVDIPTSSPLMVMVACSTGSYDKPTPSLAESLMRRASGPAGVIASSRVSTPYSNAILSIELLGPLYGETMPLTTGELLLRAKRAMIPDSESPLRRQMESMAGAFYEPDPEKRRLDRSEHLALYQLFGDPSLTLRRPAPFEIEAPEEVTAGKTMTVKGATPFPGKLRVELVRRRDRPPRAPRGKRTLEEMAKTYAKANDRVVAAATVTLDGKSKTFDATLEIPEDLDGGTYVVRAYVEGESRSAMAAASTRVF